MKDSTKRKLIIGGLAVAGIAGGAYALYEGRRDSNLSGSLEGLTRKDFQAAADILKRHGACGIADDFADWFRRENPRFQRGRFLRAAGC